MKRLTVGLTIALLAFVARPALAQDLISRPIQPMEQFRLDSGSGVGAKWGPWQVGPYHGTLLSDPTTPSLTLYCVDFVHAISVGDVVNVNTFNLGDDNADLSASLTRLKNDTNNGGVIDSRLMQYRQAAFLAAMFDSYAGFGALGFDTDGDGDVDETFGSFMGGDLKRNAWSGIHAAIWSILTPGFPAAFPAAPVDVVLAYGMAAPFLHMATEAAEGGFTGFDFSQWSVFTDKAGDGHIDGTQEFLVRTVVPEPATVILLLSGLVVLLGVGRRRLSQLGDTDT